MFPREAACWQAPDVAACARSVQAEMQLDSIAQERYYDLATDT